MGVAEDDKRSTAWIEGFAILAAVMVCVLVTAINDYQKEREFIKLNKEKEKSKPKYQRSRLMTHANP